MKVHINGCDIYYEIYGESKDTDTIMFVHGGPGLGDCRGDIHTFSSLAEDYQLVFIDMRGSGRSDDIPPYTHKQWVEDLDELRKHLNIDKVILHGSSYGGFIVQEYVLAYPNNVKAMMLNVTAPDNEHHFIAIENALNSERTNIDKEDLLRLFEGEVASNEDFRSLYGGILPLYAMKRDIKAEEEKLNNIYFHYETHNEAFKNNLTNFDLKDRLHTIQVPTLVTAGKQDWIIPSKYSKAIAERIKPSTFVLFQNNGHSLVRERSDMYIDLVKKFLNGDISYGSIEVE